MRQTSKIAEKLDREIREVMDELRKERGELELKIYLARAEVRDEWEKAEKKLQDLKARVELVGKEAREASEDVATAARPLAHELKAAYKRIYQRLKQL